MTKPRNYTRKTSSQVVENHLTGEKQQTTTNFIEKVELPNFMKMYHDLLREDKIRIGLTEWELLLYFLDRGNNSRKYHITISAWYVETVAQEIGCTTRAVRLAIASLDQKNVILKMRRSEYLINPKYFWHSDESSRKKAIIDYNEEKMLVESRNKQEQTL